MDYSKLTKKQIIEGIIKENIYLSDLSEEFKNDKYIALEVIKNNGYWLEFVSEELKDDKVIVLEAIKNSILILEIKKKKS